MLKLRYRHLLPFVIAALLSACGGGGQTVPVSTTGATVPVGSSRNVQLGPQATTVMLPLTANIAGRLVFPAVPTPATVAVSASETPPAGVALDTRRHPQSGTLTVYEYVTIVPATTVSLPSIPAMTFIFPVTTTLTGKSMFYGISDLNSQGGRMSFDTQGPGTIAGQTVSFPQIPTPLTLQAGHSYTFILYGTTVKVAGATKIYVASTVGNMPEMTGVVTTYNADGTPTLPTFTTPTLNGATLASKLGIAADPSGKLYISNNDRVLTYTADGKPTQPTISLPSFASAIALNSNGEIFVTQFQPGGAPGTMNLLSVYTAGGSDTGVHITAGLLNTQGVAIGPNGKIYVTNSPYIEGEGTPSITTYTQQGVQTTPTITGSLKGPGAIAIDATGKLYVADSNPDSIKTFLPDGTPTTPTITTGISGPSGIAVDAAGKIYVTNYNTANVTTYNPNGTQTSPTIATGGFYVSGVAVH